MVFASTAPSSSTTATTCRRDFLLGVDLWLIGVIVDVVMALKCRKRDKSQFRFSKGYIYIKKKHIQQLFPRFVFD